MNVTKATQEYLVKPPQHAQQHQMKKHAKMEAKLLEQLEIVDVFAPKDTAAKIVKLQIFALPDMEASFVKMEAPFKELLDHAHVNAQVDSQDRIVRMYRADLGFLD